MLAILLPTRERVSWMSKTLIVCKELAARLLGSKAIRERDIQNWERQISMASMSLNKSTIFMMAKEDCHDRLCWGCNQVTLTVFKDTATGGYLCKKCMPDVYWAGVQLAETEGIRDPEPGEVSWDKNT